MTVPLSAEAFISSDNRQRLRLWRVGGKCDVVASPIMPYAFASQPMTSHAMAVQRKALSTLSEATWYAHEWRNERDRAIALKRWRSQGVKIAEAQARLVERLLVDDPAWFKRFSDGTRPKVMYVDIEQLTDGTAFPERTAPVISIAWAIDDGPVECVTAGGDEAPLDVVALFAVAVKRCDPAVIVGFNLESYDLPVLAAHGVTLSRDGSAPSVGVKKRRTSSGDVPSPTFSAAGRVVYDVRWPAELDMALSGIADRKLKTIAEWLGLPHVREDASNTAALSAERLRAYNVSDVELLRSVAKRYLPDKLALAEFIGAPYDSVLNGGSSFAGGIIAARVNRDAGIVSDGSNESRYAEHIPEGSKFEGATVALRRAGRFAPCWKADYASLYPTLIVALGAGPDNTRLLFSNPHICDPPNDVCDPLLYMGESEGARLYRVVDKTLQRDFLIEVRGTSQFAARIDAMMQERLEVKRQAKASGSAELEARAGMLKIVLNSVYGGMGADFSAHGSKAVAMLVTAGGRAMAEALERCIDQGDSIEVDTDGVYYAGRERTAHTLNVSVNAVALERYAMRPVFAVDVDRYDAAYFYKAKSYGVLDAGEATWYGGAFKGSRHAPLFRRVIDEVGGALLRGEPIGEHARAARDLSRYATEDFVQRVKWSGNPKSSPGAEVAASYMRVNGRAPVVGERMLYVKTPSGYSVPAPGVEIDAAYYAGVVDDALLRLGVAKPKRKLRSVVTVS